MKWTTALVAALLASGSVSADEIVLKNGKRIPFRVLRDGIDVVHVQTSDNQAIEIPKDSIKGVEFVVPKAPITGGTFTGDDTIEAEKPVNLLRMIDPGKHGVTGEWRFAAGALQGSKGLLEVPYVPPTESYDIEILLYRTDGDSTVSIGMAVGGRAFALVLDWGSGEASGIGVIGGKRVYENVTRINGEQLPRRKPRHIVCAVRPGRIVVMMDRKEVINWEGDLGSLSHWSRPKNEANLFLEVPESGIAVTKYVATARRPQ